MKPAMPQRLRPLVAACLAGWLSACSLIPQHELPPSPVAAQWPVDAGAVTAGAAAAADLPWQRFVQDDQLRELIALALDGSRDLRSAVLAIEQSRAQYQIRRADEWPTVNASSNASRSAPNAYAAIGGPRVASTYTVGVGLSAWEIDFFGRIDALKEAALAQYLATTEARKSAQISLIAAVSSAWLQLKTDTALLALAERTLATREQSLKLTQLRLDNGASSALDLRQAQSRAATARSSSACARRTSTCLRCWRGSPCPSGWFPPFPGARTRRNWAACRPSTTCRPACLRICCCAAPTSARPSSNSSPPKPTSARRARRSSRASRSPRRLDESAPRWTACSAPAVRAHGPSRPA
jgi:multidrug efflux system outer membrane protein